MDYLIHEENKPDDMMQLGGWYYECRRFDIALKYYEMASAYDIDAADECLGYIWYYGRTGEKDYGKAFRHYAKSMERGNLVSTYKVADMYRNGYYQMAINHGEAIDQEKADALLAKEMQEYQQKLQDMVAENDAAKKMAEIGIYLMDFVSVNPWKAMQGNNVTIFMSA